MASISVVIPVYQAESILSELISRLKSSLSAFASDFEILLVDDRSLDSSWNRILDLAKKNKEIKAIRLSKNFGQHYAITAGIDHARKEWLVVMDCDLQDPPESIHALYQKAQEGYKIVLANRLQRKNSFVKKMTSAFFYWGFKKISGLEYNSKVGNFGIYHRDVYQVISSMREPMRAFGPMIQWVGFTKTEIDIVQDKRLSGSSTYNWKKLTKLALDIMIAYTNNPLNVTVKLGLLLSITALLFASYNLFAYFTGEIKVVGYASIIVSIWFLSGLIIFSLGIIGVYIGRSFDAIKERPLYIIEDKLNID